jgi:DNA-binding MarR family transcriptional regulator
LSFEVLDRVEHRIVESRIPEFSYAWDALTLNQRKTLKLIACTHGKNIYGAENLAGFGFRTASQVSVALIKLERGGFIDKNDEWKIHDPFFKRWLQSR